MADDNRYGGSRGGYDDRDRYERPSRCKSVHFSLAACVYACEAYCLSSSPLADDDRREPRYDDRRGGGYERGYDRGGHDYRSGGGDYRGGAGDYRGGGGSGGGYRDERSYDPRSRY
jgi:hypothetical protein